MQYELTEEQKREELLEMMSSKYGAKMDKATMESIVNGVIDEASKRIADEEAPEILANAEFDLDAALDSYDPTFPRYEPSQDAFEFFILMRLIQGSDFEFDTPIAHYFMVDCLLGYVNDPMMFPYSEEVCRSIQIDINYLGFMASRGLAKSTVGISFFSVYSAIKGKLPNGIGKVYFYLLLAASSKGGARVNALAVRAMCEDSAWLKDYFEDMRFTETESEFTRKDPTGKIPKKDRGFLIRYQGINTGVRGSRYGERRPCCHIRGTEVTTEHGTYLVEDHPEMYKSEGHWETCSEVSLRGLPNNEIVSKDHSYLTKISARGKCITDNGNKLPRYSESTPRWTKASELTTDHWIASRIDNTVEEVQPILHRVRVGGVNRNEKGQIFGPVYDDVLMSHKYMQENDWWWLYGLWLGDGTLGNRRSGQVKWVIANTQETTVGAKVINILDKLGSAYSIQRRQNGCYEIVTSNAALNTWMASQKGGNSIKTMPDWVLKIDKEKQKQLLLGYIAADGYIDRNKRSNQVRINSVNYKVLEQLQVIGARLGLPSHIRNTKKAGEQYFTTTDKVHNVNHQWEIRFKDNVEEILGIKGITNGSNYWPQVHIKNGLMWRQVREVKDTEKEYELIPIQCNNKELEQIAGTVHAYETKFGISKNCILFDDAILNTAAAYSKVMMDNLDEILNSDATNALKGGGKGRVLLFFTPFHYGDVNTKAILNGSFTPIIIPMAKNFNADSKVKISDIKSSWESMHPRVSIVSLINKAKKSKKLRMFMQERMLRLTSGTERLVPDECLQYTDMKVIENNLDGYNIYITTDYTTTSGESSDFSGVATWAVNSNEDWFLLNLTLRKMGMETQYDITLNEAAKYKRKMKHVEIGVEIDGNQSAHVFALEKLMREQGTYYTFAKQKGQLDSPRKGILSKNAGAGSKHERFRIASQVLLQKKMWLPAHLEDTPDMNEFVAQIKGATHETFTRSDDGPDLITMGVVSMHVYYPTYEAVHSNIDENTHYYGTSGDSGGSAYDNY